MTPEELKTVISNHEKWLRGEDGGSYADPSGENLSDADLSGANLSYANLSRANLSYANLSDADLSYANLSGANLSYANLSDADLSYANLSGANLFRANLSRANLSGANLSDADLSDANLYNTNLPPYAICPEVGEFIAFKKLKDDIIARLLIPEDALRTSSLVGRKCRASKVKVLSLSRDEVGFGLHDGTEYRVGAIVEPDFYDPDPRVECTHGIHFFVTQKEAEDYC